jgi:hypothetical protein
MRIAGMVLVVALWDPRFSPRRKDTLGERLRGFKPNRINQLDPAAS